MDHSYSVCYDDVLLRPLLHKDIEFLRKWRNDQEASKYLRNIGTITPEMKEKWFASYLKDEDEITFSIVEIKSLHRMVGSVSLYNFSTDKKQAEVGKIQIGDVEAHGKGIGRKALVMIMDFGFKKLNLEKIVAGVNQKNIAAHSNDMKIGFRIVGTHPSVSEFGGTEDEIKIDQETLERVNPYCSKIQIDCGFEK